jgi:hypothetical protein
MTIDELIEKAAQLSGWKLDGGKIRRLSGFYHRECPITAVANALLPEEAHYNTSEWHRAAEYLGLPHDDAWDIVTAADTEFYYDTPLNELRKIMLTKFQLRRD